LGKGVRKGAFSFCRRVEKPHHYAVFKRLLKKFEKNQKKLKKGVDNLLGI